MDFLIRIAVVLVVVGVILVIVTPLATQILSYLSFFSAFLATYAPVIAPYLLFGRALFNLLMGNVIVGEAVLWMIIILPISYYVASLTARIFRLFIK